MAAPSTSGGTNRRWRAQRAPRASRGGTQVTARAVDRPAQLVADEEVHISWVRQRTASDEGIAQTRERVAAHRPRERQVADLLFSQCRRPFCFREQTVELRGEPRRQCRPRATLELLALRGETRVAFRGMCIRRWLRPRVGAVDS